MLFLLGRSRSAISTIIGGIIVIAIMFTVIIPLFFYMNTMNDMYNSVATEMRGFDQQRGWEEIEVYAWATIEGVNITIKNKSPISVNIIRIWVISENYNPEYFTRDISVKPGDSIMISDDGAINEKIAGLENTRYYIKIATERGNLFQSLWASGIYAPGYNFPLVILPEPYSNYTQAGSKYIFKLQVVNQMPIEFDVDYVVVTLIEMGGGMAEVKMEVLEPYWHFNAGSPENPAVDTYITGEIQMKGHEPDCIKLELVGPDNFVLGAYYFRDTS